MRKLSFLALAMTAVMSFSVPALANLPDKREAPAVEQVQASVVDINTADAQTLERELSGIGAAKAQAIIEYRTQYGKFASVDELLEVKGIGPAILERNREKLGAQ